MKCFLCSGFFSHWVAGKRSLTTARCCLKMTCLIIQLGIRYAFICSVVLFFFLKLYYDLCFNLFQHFLSDLRFCAFIQSAIFKKRFCKFLKKCAVIGSVVVEVFTGWAACICFKILKLNVEHVLPWYNLLFYDTALDLSSSIGDSVKTAISRSKKE